MPLVLGAVFVFIMTGLASNRFGRRQAAVVVIVALALTAIQFSLPRFL